MVDGAVPGCGTQERWNSLAEFEPDPDWSDPAAIPIRSSGEFIEWVRWTDAEGELSWAMIELDQIVPCRANGH